MDSRLISALRRIVADTSGLPPPDKENTYVYRIENEDGEGPFKNRIDRDKWQLSGGEWMAPYDDSGFGWKVTDWLKQNWMKGLAPEIRFGFKDPSQYEEYFTEDERERLSQIKFTLNKVPAAQVWEGYTQVFYVPK